MVTQFPEGATPVRGELVSADASTAAALTIYDTAGAAVTMTSKRLYITHVSIVTASALTVELFDDIATAGTVNDGERIAGGEFAANGGIITGINPPAPCKLGNTPKVKASAAGNVRVFIQGYVKAN